MQSSCMSALMELAEKDTDVLYLTSDSGEGGLDVMFKRTFSEQSFDFGISENNMVGIASGLALSGKKPYIYSAAPFLIYRSYEFIRDDICFQNVDVNMIGVGSGLSVSTLGPTHHTTEDISLLRSLPNLTVLVPATPNQARSCLLEAYKIKSPVYIRVEMNGEKEFFAEDYSITIGKNDVVLVGREIVIFAMGSILSEVMTSVEFLKQYDIIPTVVCVSSIKPFDKENVELLAKDNRYFVSVEEHNVDGGLGSIIADTIVEKNLGVSLKKIGLKECFAKGFSSLSNIRKINHIDANSICEIVRGIFCE